MFYILKKKSSTTENFSVLLNKIYHEKIIFRATENVFRTTEKDFSTTEISFSITELFSVHQSKNFRISMLLKIKVEV